MVATLALPVSAQTVPTLRTETRVVQIQVDAKDSRGQPIAGLTKDDFTILDSGRRRAIDIFSVEDSAASPAAVPPQPVLPPNVFSNRVAAASRVATVILLDGINNYWDDVAASRLQLLKTVDRLGPSDRIAIYVATTQPAGIRIIQDFTADRERLRRTIQAYRPDAIPPAPGLGPPPPTSPGEEEFKRRAAVRDTMDAFRLLSKHLAQLPGRKSVLWLTSGLPPAQLRNMSEVYDPAVASLNEANVAVNVIDDDGVGGFKRRWGRAAQWTLRNLADDTGGKAYTGRNDIDAAVLEALQPRRLIYTLAFYLPAGECDDKFHPLAVRLNRSKVELSYRKGYYASVKPAAAPAKKREPMENALLDPQDATEIDISAHVERMPGAPRERLRLSLGIGVGQLTLHDDASGASGKIEEMFLETNPAGRLVGRITDVKQFHMTSRGRELAAAGGVPVTQEIELPETATRLLIVIRDAESGRTGTVSIDLSNVQSR